MSIVSVKSKYQIVIPQSIRNKVRIKVGDLLEARVERGKITFSPRSAVDMAIEEGLEDVRKGRVYGPFDSAEEMLASLKGKRGKSGAKTPRLR
uniref:Transcriptional regulator, AbrB family n=1 Tax=Solibacter usitatus (strain Ellin6076) TaxID=234267 RepID=Q01YD7_SOLUE